MAGRRTARVQASCRFAAGTPITRRPRPRSAAPKRDQHLAELPVRAIDMAQQPFLQIAQDQADAAKIPVHVQVPDVVQQAAMLLAVSREIRAPGVAPSDAPRWRSGIRRSEPGRSVWPGWHRCRRHPSAPRTVDRSARPGACADRRSPECRSHVPRSRPAAVATVMSSPNSPGGPAELVPAGALGAVHRGVGCRQQGIARLRMLGPYGNADAGADADGMRSEVEWRCQGSRSCAAPPARPPADPSTAATARRTHRRRSVPTYRHRGHCPENAAPRVAARHRPSRARRCH